MLISSVAEGLDAAVARQCLRAGATTCRKGCAIWLEAPWALGSGGAAKPGCRCCDGGGSKPGCCLCCCCRNSSARLDGPAERPQAPSNCLPMPPEVYTRDHNVFVACNESEAQQHLRMRMPPSPSSRTALTASATDGACTGPCADGVMDGRFDCGSCSTAHNVEWCHRRASSTCTSVNTAYNMLVIRTEVPAHTLVPQVLT